MRARTLIAVASILIVLQGATFAYVIKAENRLTRIETIIELRITKPGARSTEPPPITVKGQYHGQT